MLNGKSQIVNSLKSGQMGPICWKTFLLLMPVFNGKKEKERKNVTRERWKDRKKERHQKIHQETKKEGKKERDKERDKEIKREEI